MVIHKYNSRFWVTNSGIREKNPALVAKPANFFWNGLRFYVAGEEVVFVLNMGCFLALIPGSTGGLLKIKLGTIFLNWCPSKNFSPFCSASPEIIESKVHNGQTDRQTNILHQCVFFHSVKFATSLLTWLAGG